MVSGAISTQGGAAIVPSSRFFDWRGDPSSAFAERWELAIPDAGSPCLDRSAKSRKLSPSRFSKPKSNLRTRVYQNGEIQHTAVLKDGTSKPPKPNYGARVVSGVTRRGSKIIRRAVEAKVDHTPRPRAIFYTFTCDWEPEADPERALAQDQEFRDRLNGLLSVWRKKHPTSIEDYVLVCDLQQRGVLHAHMIVFGDVPRGIWLELRDMWALEQYELRDPANPNLAKRDELGRIVRQAGYGMGAGSFDAKRLRHPRKAANYLARYITQARKRRYHCYLDFTLELDPADPSRWEGAVEHRGGGFLCMVPEDVRISTSESDRKGRNGKPYVRDVFRGNAYSMSSGLRRFSLHTFEALWDWRSPEAKTLLAHSFSRDKYGGVYYCDSLEEAEEMLTALLELALSPPPRVPVEVYEDTLEGLHLEQSYEAAIAADQGVYAYV